MTLAAVFPGQGSQYVGMGIDLLGRFPQIVDILELGDEIADRPISRVMAGGPKDLLDDTLNAQPAIFITNYIYWRLLKQEGLEVDYAAGHSLGELSACLAAGVFSFEDGLSIVKRRSELMAEASAGAAGGMLAVLGLEDARVVEIAAAAGIEPANYNCPGQVVVAGPMDKLERGADAFKSAGAKKVTKLAVSGAFHSSAMKTPARLFGRWLEDIDFADPLMPVIGNADAEPLLTAKAVKEALARQLVSPVRWQAGIERLIRRGVTGFVEVGPGRVLSGLIRRISPEVTIEHAVDKLGA